MNDKKVIAVVAGTRPEVIKMSSVYKSLKKSQKFDTIFISTAQHRQMLDQAMQTFEIESDFDMNIMQQGQTLSDLTARILSAWKDFYSKNKVDVVLVQGDTTTVLASAIAAFYEKVKIGHVEAGLRTGNMQSPFPEEMNRRLTSPIADWNFCPTSLSEENLLKENTSKDKCFITGNTVVDSLLWMRDKLLKENVSADEISQTCNINSTFTEKFLKNKKSRWILVTGHRRESFGGGFENICKAIRQLVDKYDDLGVLYPVHLNPNVQEPVNRLLGNHERVCLISPIAYREFIWLMNNCYFVLSDSGGVQEEAPSLGKPVLVMRDTTERPEGVSAGTCTLVGTDPDKILSEAKILLENPDEYKRRSALKNPYGDGKSADRIREILEKSL